MLVLDTDMYSITVRGRSSEAARILERIQAAGQTERITIVTVEEQLEGRLAVCNKARTPDEYVIAADRLLATVLDLNAIPILGFTPAAADQFRRLKAMKVRIGTQDLRIAAIVLSLDALLLTRNLADFRKVPALKAEDWSRPA